MSCTATLQSSSVTTLDSLSFACAEANLINDSNDLIVMGSILTDAFYNVDMICSYRWNILLPHLDPLFCEFLDSILFKLSGCNLILSVEDVLLEECLWEEIPLISGVETLLELNEGSMFLLDLDLICDDVWILSPLLSLVVSNSPVPMVLGDSLSYQAIQVLPLFVEDYEE